MGNEPDFETRYGHPRMPLAERAKIFVPFDPLKGFREALAEREREAERPRDYASDEAGDERTVADRIARA